MTATRKRTSEPRPPARRAPRVELVDNWHAAWPDVLALVDRTGRRTALDLDAAGWLSARRNVLAAFVNDEPAGHASFHVRPATDDRGRVRTSDDGRAIVEAALDCVAVDEPFQDLGIEAELIRRARQRAADLRCGELRTGPTG